MNRLVLSGIILWTGAIALQGPAAAQSQPACDSVATPGSVSWTATFGGGIGAYGDWKLVLTQDGKGAVNGTGTKINSFCAAKTGSVSGYAAGAGEFSLNFDITVPCDTLKMAIVVSGPGCANATGTYTTYSTFGYDDMPVTLTDGAGVLPTGETAPVGYGSEVNHPAVLIFWQNLAPTTYDFQGRTVNESFPNGFASNCAGASPVPYIAGDVYPLVNGSANNGTPVDGITTGYADYIGLPDTDDLDTIRRIGDAPCTISATQVMTIDTSSGTNQYQTNGVSYTIGQTTITAVRNGVAQTKPVASLEANILPAVHAAVFLSLLSSQGSH